MNRVDIKRQARAVLSKNYWKAMLFTFIPGIVLGLVGFTVIGTILAAPIVIGGMYGLWQLYNERDTSSNDLGRGFQQPNLIRNYIQLVLMGVFLILWSLLFIVPGIIKSYSYAMVPFLLADPDVQEEDVITRSRQMMDGHKWELFMLQLSFLGWILLGTFTLGILNFFFVTPYFQLATAGFYQELKLRQ